MYQMKIVHPDGRVQESGCSDDCPTTKAGFFVVDDEIMQAPEKYDEYIEKLLENDLPFSFMGRPPGSPECISTIADLDGMGVKEVMGVVTRLLIRVQSPRFRELVGRLTDQSSESDILDITNELPVNKWDVLLSRLLAEASYDAKHAVDDDIESFGSFQGFMHMLMTCCMACAPDTDWEFEVITQEEEERLEPFDAFLATLSSDSRSDTN